MYKIEEEFKEFIENCEKDKYKSALDIPAEIWGLHGWEQIKKNRVEELFLPFIRQNIERAKKTIGVYKKAYQKINPDKIETINDFWNIPALIKDSGVQGIGFRDKVKMNPYVLLPSDVKSPLYVYKSGGTKGSATPTFIIEKDIEIESIAFARACRYEGMKKGDIALTTYNPTHKGGEEIKEALIKNGITYIPRRTTDDANEIINTIKNYNVNVLFAVQPPIKEGDQDNKGVGIDLMSLIEAGQDVLEKQIKLIFLGGYRLVDEAIAWAESFNKPLVTTLGSSEAIPQATNTGTGNNSRLCKYNNLHWLHGPHYMEILKEESKVLVPVKKGETGLLAYTTIAREGTIYIRYFPGDQAKLLAHEGECSCGIKSEVVTDVMRIDHPEDIVSTGCCIG